MEVSKVIRHVTDMVHKCVSHSSVDTVLKTTNPNYVFVGGERQMMHAFTESFTHHVELLWSYGGGLSWNMTHTTRISSSMSGGFNLSKGFLVTV